MAFLTNDYFKRDVLTVARDLIGVELVWQGCSGIIVETEAYAVEGDPACHTATRPSAREFVKSQAPGTAYVYFNYGMYWLFNLLVKGGERDGLILIRALDPRLGIGEMQQRRQRPKVTDLCSGPGKLALALGIGGIHHGAPMTGSRRLKGCGLRSGPESLEVLSDVRVGISQAADFPWRFLARDNPHVSVKHGRVKVPIK
ncbi:MAG TPA: 3-methyladenine DNA glycosylase [Verrucomicrobiales bacterium]|nr:3-methyladenine DNA glycosylase [Verrucomicrobiales bacterium]